MRGALAVAFCLTVCVGARAAELPGEATVTKMLEAVERQDIGTFKSVVAYDAMVAVNDVGGPLTIDAIPFNKFGCKFVGFGPGKKLPPPDDKKYDFVDATWSCPNPDKQALHPVKVSFIVQAGQVKAVVMGMKDQ